MHFFLWMIAGNCLFSSGDNQAYTHASVFYGLFKLSSCFYDGTDAFFSRLL